MSKIENINRKADAVVDQGLEAVKKSPYSVVILVWITLSAMSVGWFAHALFG